MLVFGFSGSVQTRGQERGAEGKALEVALVVEALRGGREQKRSLISVQVGAVAAQRRKTSSLGLSCCISSFSMSAGVWAVFALTMTSSILIMSSGKVRLLRWFHSSTNRELPNSRTLTPAVEVPILTPSATPAGTSTLVRGQSHGQIGLPHQRCAASHTGYFTTTGPPVRGQSHGLLHHPWATGARPVTRATSPLPASSST